MATPTSLPATFVAGNVLTAAQMNALRGAFRILQVVQATDGTQRTTTSTSFVDASISVTITPTSADSDVMLIWAFGQNNFGGNPERGIFQITDSSDVAISGAEYVVSGTGGANDFRGAVVLIGYDSPATTSATTYKGRFRSAGTGGTTTSVNGGNTGQLFALEISA